MSWAFRLRSLRYLNTLQAPLCANGLKPFPTILQLQSKDSSDGDVYKNLARGIHSSFGVFKYNKSKVAAEESDDEADSSDEHFKDERDSKVVKTKVNSLRADLLLKAGLGIARNKIEVIFYESKLRVNGQKVPKKSIQLSEGDEIDVIRGFSQKNPQHLVVARVVILSATEREEGFNVALRRYKSLLIENYKGVNAFKSSETINH